MASVWAAALVQGFLWLDRSGYDTCGQPAAASALQHVGKIGGPVNDVTLYRTTHFPNYTPKSPISQLEAGPEAQIVGIWAHSQGQLQTGQEVQIIVQMGARWANDLCLWASLELASGGTSGCNLESGSFGIK